MTYLPGTQTIGAIIQNPDSSFTALGTDNGSAMLLNLDTAGSVGCKDSAANVTVSFPSLTVDTLAQPNSSIVFTNFGATLTEVNINIDTTLITCPGAGNCYVTDNTHMLCGKAVPLLAPVLDSTTSCSDSLVFAVSSGTSLFTNYSDSLTGDFEQRYLDKCMQAYKHETFTVTHKESEYHYTLYYYDQAGNLLKTVPPPASSKTPTAPG
ncbi:hypothetical protein ACQ86N_41170 [Puia sp. P3]|uniref:hypothetical protein n=1 Tax=Puia sp. P3 TaxID=3423952 RepID=UPI003D676D2D